MTTNELKAYAKGGAVAEEVFTAIKTVFAFNGANNEIKRFLIFIYYLIHSFLIKSLFWLLIVMRANLMMRENMELKRVL